MARYTTGLISENSQNLVELVGDGDIAEYDPTTHIGAMKIAIIATLKEYGPLSWKDLCEMSILKMKDDMVR